MEFAKAFGDTINLLCPDQSAKEKLQKDYISCVKETINQTKADLIKQGYTTKIKLLESPENIPININELPSLDIIFQNSEPYLTQYCTEKDITALLEVFDKNFDIQIVNYKMLYDFYNKIEQKAS